MSSTATVNLNKVEAEGGFIAKDSFCRRYGANTDNNNGWDGWEYPQNNIKLNVTYIPGRD